MVKREWTGPPIDLTDQHFKERPMSGTPTRDDDDAETVGGSTEDDLFSESTDNIPAYIDRESTPDKILDVIGKAVIGGFEYAVLKNQENFNFREVRQILNDYLEPRHFERIKGIEAAPIKEIDDLTPKQQDVIEAFKSHSDFPDVTPGELADAGSFSRNTARRAIHTMYPGLRDFDDLNESTKVAIQVWAYEGLDASQTKLNQKWDIPMRPLGDAKRVYPDLVEDQQPIEESTVEAAVERYKSDHARPTKEKTSSPDPVEVEPKGEIEYPTTECYQWFLNEIANNPGATPTEIAEGSGWTSTNYYNVLNAHPRAVKKEIEEAGVAESVDEIYDLILDKTAHLGEWNLGGSDGWTELEQEIDAEEVAEIEAEPEAEIETEPEIDFNATERFGFDIEEEMDVEVRSPPARVMIQRDLVEGIADRLVESDEYKSMTELVNTAVKKELNGGFAPASDTTVEADVIETVIESLYGERKANAIRTLLADE